ncbi:hypothetical protein [Thermodesulfatator atlanticus]|nr:hypothetical protein [Thermodesulfatator atlanticus]
MRCLACGIERPAKEYADEIEAFKERLCELALGESDDKTKAKF